MKNSSVDQQKRPHLRIRRGLFMSVLYRGALGSFDCTDGAAVNASTTVRACCCIDHVLVALLADRVDRASVCTSGAVDTLVVNSVGHGLSSSLKILFRETFGSLPQWQDSVQPKQTPVFCKKTCNLKSHTLTFHNMFYACKSL